MSRLSYLTSGRAFKQKKVIERVGALVENCGFDPRTPAVNGAYIRWADITANENTYQLMLTRPCTQSLLGLQDTSAHDDFLCRRIVGDLFERASGYPTFGSVG